MDGPRFEEPADTSSQEEEEEEVEFTEDVDSTPTYTYRPFFPLDSFNPFGKRKMLEFLLRIVGL